jgi:hypothetical protein
VTDIVPFHSSFQILFTLAVYVLQEEFSSSTPEAESPSEPISTQPIAMPPPNSTGGEATETTGLRQETRQATYGVDASDVHISAQ